MKRIVAVLLFLKTNKSLHQHLVQYVVLVVARRVARRVTRWVARRVARQVGQIALLSVVKTMAPRPIPDRAYVELRHAPTNQDCTARRLQVRVVLGRLVVLALLGLLRLLLIMSSVPLNTKQIHLVLLKVDVRCLENNP